MRDVTWKREWRVRARVPLFLILLACTLVTRTAAQDRLEPEDRQFLASLEEKLTRAPLSANGLLDLRELIEDVPDSWEVLQVVYRWRLLQGRWVSERSGEGDAREFDPLVADLDQLAGRILRLADGQPAALRLVVGLVVKNHELHGRYAEALARVDELLDKFPNEIDAWIEKVRLLVVTGEWNLARKVSQTAATRIRGLSLAPGERNWYLGRLLLLTADHEPKPDVRRQALERTARHLALAEKAFRDSGDVRHAASYADLAAVHLVGRQDGDARDVLSEYKDILKEAPYLPGVHLGLARTYIFRDEIHEAEQQITEALGKRPDDPTALALQASFRLRDHRYSDAREILDHALRVNPHHREALATLAACQYLQADETWEATMGRALAVDEHYGRGYRILGDAVAIHYRFGEAIPFYRKSLEIEPLEHAARIGLGQCLANTGDLEAAYQELDRARRLDDFRYRWRDNMLKLLDYYRRIPLVSRGSFRYRIQIDDSKVFLDYLNEQLTAAYGDLAGEYGAELPESITVELLRTHPDFSVRTIGFSGLGALGVCFGPVIALLSPASKLRGSFVWARTARHELAHVFSLTRSRLRVPRWLTEGLSVFEEGHGRPCWARDMEFQLFNAYHNGELIGIAQMNAAFRGPRILFGYYQAGLFCRFIAERYGFERIVRMLELYGQDRETADVFGEVLGCSLEEIDGEFRDWVFSAYLKGIRVYPIYSARRRDELRGLVAARPDDAELREKLAWAFLQSGHSVDRDVQLARALELDPERGGLWFLKGHRALEYGDKKEALTDFEGGLSRGADDMFVRLQLASLYAARGEMDKMSASLVAAKACFPHYVGPGNAYDRLARYAELAGDEKEAMQERQELVEIDETAVAPRLWLVGYHEKRHEYQEMAEVLEELIEIDPFQRRPHEALAHAYRELGRHAEAIRELHVALAVDPWREPDYNPPPSEDEARPEAREKRAKAALYVELARLYEDLGDVDAAGKAAARALELDPENEEAKAVVERLAEHDR